MPSYSYKAFDSEGSIQSGFINADSERSARKEIKSLNLIPHKLKKIKSQTSKRFKINCGWNGYNNIYISCYAWSRTWIIMV